MAGIFGLFDYTKEGPGVDPDEPQKSAIGEFFSILGTKFWRIIQINMLVFILSIPALIVSFLVVNWLFPNILPVFSYPSILAVVESLSESLVEGITAEAFASHLFVSTMLVLTASFVGLQVFTVGPVHAGVTYLFRNISRREPAFTWLDFKENAKQNLKQSLLHSLLTALVAIIIGIAILYYTRVMIPSIMKSILQGVILVFTVFFMMMQMYIYQIMITFDLPLKHIYRNAFLLSFMKLPSNLLVLAIQVILLTILPIITIWLIPNGLASFVIFLLYFFILFGFNLYLSNFQANRQIQKYMMPPEEKDEGLYPYREDVEDVEDVEEDLLH